MMWVGCIQSVEGLNRTKKTTGENSPADCLQTRTGHWLSQASSLLTQAADLNSLVSVIA